MFELVAQVGEYIAITALCVSCWLAGRSVRSGSAAQAIAAYVESHSSPIGDYARIHSSQAHTSPNQRAAAVRDPLAAKDRGDDGKITPDYATRLHELIRTGDLSDEGVLQSLVAMAEDNYALASEAEAGGWRFAGSAMAETQNCPKARVLTRHGRSVEPLPADLADPLTPAVLSRYRMYAQECGPKV